MEGKPTGFSIAYKKKKDVRLWFTKNIILLFVEYKILKINITYASFIIYKNILNSEKLNSQFNNKKIQKLLKPNLKLGTRTNTQCIKCFLFKNSITFYKQKNS